MVAVGGKGDASQKITRCQSRALRSLRSLK